MTGLGHDLGMTITAEGVETEQQQLLLKTIGCDLLQGFYLGMPCAAAEFQALFEKQAANRPAADYQPTAYRALRK
jgi:EAL domain-containing protein (putative c-di-GMP-specific phosphodiesterase class I)